MVDDHLGLGGTLASLKGHIEANGGRVIGATTLTSSRSNIILAMKTETLEVLRKRYGTELEDWWKDRFGQGFDELTEPEGQWLLRGKDADGVRSRLAQGEG